MKAPLLYSSDIETIAEDEERLTAEIVEQMAAIREWGGKFVVPIPELKIL